ncbi:MAG: adenylate/guanylate cyclase domain-containing protein [Desulfobacter sp.]|nr:adenylate/guanylate cyclase domain-containing protein [Desulfobacter sp.]
MCSNSLALRTKRFGSSSSSLRHARTSSTVLQSSAFFISTIHLCSFQRNRGYHSFCSKRQAFLKPGKWECARRISDISDPIFDSDLGQETVTLTLTLVDTLGWPSGELNLKISFDYLLKDILSLGWWQSDMACIVDQQGQYMAHTNMTMKERHTLGGENDPMELAVYEKMNRFPSGTVNSQGHPPKMVAGFHRLEHVPWTIILFAKGSNIFAPIIRYRNMFGAVSLVLIFIVLMLIRRHVCSIVDQIKALSNNAGLVSQGIYGPPVKFESRDEIGQLVVNYNEMVNGLKQRDFIRDFFGRYVDPEFAKSLLEHPDAGRLGGKRREVVLMMSDIRGFTPLAETLSPEVIIRILNRYFSHMIRIIQEYNGIIVDFFGDAILVFFDPLSGQVCGRALCAVQCAVKKQASMADFNRLMTEEKFPELSMGIGINAGPVVVGNIGSKTRAKYGVVGSAVNITSRIQTKALENEVLVSDTIFACIKDEVDINRTINADLKGIENKVTLRSIKNFLRK